MHTFKPLSIIIPNYNGEKLLPQFFPSVLEAANNYPGWKEIIIVDDLSADNSILFLDDLLKNNSLVKVIYNQKNLGFSATCNAGIKISKGEILFFLNNDVKLSADYFNHFNKYFIDENTFAVTTCAYNFNSNKPLDGLKTGKWKRGFPRVTKNIFNEEIQRKEMEGPLVSFSIQGAYFFANADKVKKLKGFDELFSPYLYEETDLAYRALKRGWTIYYEPTCIAYHAVSSSIKKLDPIKKRVIYTRNRIIFVWKNIHSPKLLFNHFLFLSLKLITFNRVYIQAMYFVLTHLRSILIKRRIERRQSVVTDYQLFNNFNFSQNKLH